MEKPVGVGGWAAAGPGTLAAGCCSLFQLTGESDPEKKGKKDVGVGEVHSPFPTSGLRS